MDGMCARTLLGKRAAFACGFASLWVFTQAYVYNVYTDLLIASNHPSLALTFGSSVPLFMALSLLARGSGRFGSQALRARGTICAWGAAAASFVLAYVLPTSGTDSGSVIAAGVFCAALLGLFVVEHLSLWFGTLLTFPWRDQFGLLLVSWGLYELLISANVLGFFAAPVTWALFPLVSWACMRFLRQAEVPTDRCEESGPDSSLVGDSEPFPRLVLWACALLGLLSELMNKAIVAFGDYGSPLLRVVTSAVIVAALAASFAIAKHQRPQGRSFTRLLIYLLILYLTVLAVIAVGGLRWPVVRRIWSAFGLLLKLLAFAALEHHCQSNPSDCVKAVAAYVVLFLALPLTIANNALFEAGSFKAVVGNIDIGHLSFIVLLAITIAVLIMALRYEQRLQRAPVQSIRSQEKALIDRALGNLGLSERELQVALLVYQGRSAKRVGEALGVSEHTVNTHLSHIYRKLGIHSRGQLMEFVDSHGS